MDAGAKAAMKITGIKARMLGIDGFRNLLEKTNWKLDRVVETNPGILFFYIKEEGVSN